MMKRNYFIVLLLVMAMFAFAAGSAEVGETETPEAVGHGETELVVYSTIFAEYAEAMKAGFEALPAMMTCCRSRRL